MWQVVISRDTRRELHCFKLALSIKHKLSLSLSLSRHIFLSSSHPGSGIMMQTHAINTPSVCFAVLGLLRRSHRSVTGLVIQSLVASMILSFWIRPWDSFGSDQHVARSTSVSARRHRAINRINDHVTLFLRDLHMPRVSEKIATYYRSLSAFSACFPHLPCTLSTL